MIYILAFVFLVISGFTYGQKDPSAEVYLNKISSDLDPGHSLQIDFNFIREDLQTNNKFEGSGSLVLMGEKYRMELDEVMIFFDGEKQYSLNKQIEEVYISIPDSLNKEFMFSDPIQLLRNYKEKFKYRLVGQAEFLGAPTEEVQLYPETLGGPYALLKLFFSADGGEIKAIVLRHKEGILYTMIVVDTQKKEDPGIDFFRFNSADYPNVDIIELLE